MHLEKVANYVIEAVRDELHDETIDIYRTTALQELDGFDSLLVVRLIERLERQFDIEIDPALILPETFANPLTIATAVLRSRQ